MAPPPSVIRPGTVVGAIGWFEHAVQLAHGQPPTSDRQAPTASAVPRADMRASNEISVALLRLFQDWNHRASGVFPANVAHAVYSLTGAAEDAARRLESATREQLGRSSGDTAPALTSGWLPVWINGVRSAWEPFEIIVGERPLKGSTLESASTGHWDTVEGLSMYLPGIAELIVAYQVIAGKSLSGRDLSVSERIFAAVATVIPFAVGPAIRGVSTAASITRRSVLVAMANRGFFRTMTVTARGMLSLRMAIGLRLLTEAELQQLLAILRSTARMTVQETNHLNYCLARIDTASVIGQWIVHADREFGAGARGFRTLSGAKPNTTEAKAMQRLADVSGKRVVAIPEIPPENYPGVRQRPGVTYPDALWGEELAEFKEVRGGSAVDQILYIGKKSKQAGTAVVEFAADSNLRAADILPHLEALWANPDHTFLKQIVFLLDDGMKVVVRPGPYIAAFTQGIARLGYPTRNAYVSVVHIVTSAADGETPIGPPDDSKR
jgi:hypothetical protein